MTGWIFTFNGWPLSWASKKQHSISQSSMEFELIAGLFASTEGIWLIRLRKGFQHAFSPIPLFTDNQSFILFTKNDINNNRMKHINTHYHYTQDQVNIGNIQLHYIASFDNVADILMKALLPRKHIHILNILGICHA